MPIDDKNSAARISEFEEELERLRRAFIKVSERVGIQFIADLNAAAVKAQSAYDYLNASPNDAEPAKETHHLSAEFSVEYDDDCYTVRWVRPEGEMDSLIAFQNGDLIVCRSSMGTDRLPAKKVNFRELIQPSPESQTATIKEAHKLLLWAAASFDAHVHEDDHPETQDGYLESAELYRAAAARLKTLLGTASDEPSTSGEGVTGVETAEALSEKVMQDIIEECEREKIFLGTANAREIVQKHILAALSKTV